MRKEEREAIRALISDEYESEDAYIQAVWDGVVGLLRARSAYLVVLRLGDGLRAYGAFYDLRVAKKRLAEWTAALSTLQGFVQPVNPPDALDTVDEPPSSQYSNRCPKCEHPKFAHGWGGKVGVGCIVGSVWPRAPEPWLTPPPPDYSKRCYCTG